MRIAQAVQADTAYCIACKPYRRQSNWIVCTINKGRQAHYSACTSCAEGKLTTVNAQAVRTVHGQALYIRGASKIKLKNVNKKRMAPARRQIFFGISQGIHC